MPESQGICSVIPNVTFASLLWGLITVTSDHVRTSWRERQAQVKCRALATKACLRELVVVILQRTLSYLGCQPPPSSFLLSSFLSHPSLVHPILSFKFVSILTRFCSLLLSFQGCLLMVSWSCTTTLVNLLPWSWPSTLTWMIQDPVALYSPWNPSWQPRWYASLSQHLLLSSWSQGSPVITVSLVTVFEALRAWDIYTEIKNEAVRNPSPSVSLDTTN